MPQYEHRGVFENTPGRDATGQIQMVIYLLTCTPYLSRSIFFELVKVFFSSPVTTIR
jgi:hypothetical protein